VVVLWKIICCRAVHARALIACLASLDLFQMSSPSCHLPCVDVHSSCPIADGEPLQRDSLIHVPLAELRVPGMPVPLITFNCLFWNVSSVYGLVCLVCSTSAQAWKSLSRTEASATARLHCVDANHRADLSFVTDGCMQASWLVRSVTNYIVLTSFTSAKQIGLESITLDTICSHQMIQRAQLLIGACGSCWTSGSLRCTAPKLSIRGFCKSVLLEPASSASSWGHATLVADFISTTQVPSQACLGCARCCGGC
jgi:hypothetical protein